MISNRLNVAGGSSKAAVMAGDANGRSCLHLQGVIGGGYSVRGRPWSIPAGWVVRLAQSLGVASDVGNGINSTL
jgi:hypothetical protein